jgi:solute:Na+ symporter, SSS family
LGSILIFILSKYLNKIGKGKVQVYDLGISLSGIGRSILAFLLLQMPFIAMVLFNIISPQLAALPASLACFIVFIWFLKKEKETIPFYKSDIFYAGLLTAAMVWIMFYFA